MAISRVSQATAQSATITIPGTYAAGDLIVIAASRTNNTPATTPSGWVNLSSIGSVGLALSTACRYAQSSSEPSPTFTNANILHCVVYRSSLGIVFPGMALGLNVGTSATIGYTALAQYKTGLDANWYLGVAAQLNTTNSLETAPTGMANVNFDSVTGLKSAFHDTNGDQLSNWPSTTVTLVTSAVFRSAVIQLAEMAYTFPSGGGGIFFRPGMSGGMSE